MSEIEEMAAFLAARLDEDEALALAVEEAAREWHSSPIGDGVEVLDGRKWTVLYGDAARPRDARHIARHDPARALREVVADRKLIAAYRQTLSVPPTNEQVDQTAWRLALEFALQLRAAVYSDHPAWKP